MSSNGCAIYEDESCIDHFALVSLTQGELNGKEGVKNRDRHLKMLRKVQT